MARRRIHYTEGVSAPAARPATGAFAHDLNERRYGWLSTRPLHILFFLLPLIALHWVGSARYLSSEGTVAAIKAERILGSFFDFFVAGTPYLPGAMIIVVLLVWHVLSKDRFRVRGWVLAGMVGESILWTPPLVVMLALIGAGSENVPPAMSLQDGQAVAIEALGWQARLTIAIGAGIYEELLFRMILIAAVHLIAVDLIDLKDMHGKVLAVAVSAIAFALYHQGVIGAGWSVNVPLLLAYCVAGAYFGTLFLWRGFGIVVGVHAAYDIVVLLLG
jgi:hypothetical protein